jgi:SNF2 family DNA or RNA helicase
LKQSDESSKEPKVPEMGLLDESHINVVKSAKGSLLESSNTKVVIASYGLITNLVKNEVLVPGLFKCIIVDESHMLKNKKSKRTKAVLPLLQSANRVIMLSGTPALSRPAELYPQISVLGRRLNVFQNENEFEERYVKDKYSDPSYKELHTMLSNTVMIRRMKEDQLKDIPNKRRENVFVRVHDKALQDQITDGLLYLRQGTGQLGKLSVIYQKDLAPSDKSQSSTSDELNSKVLLNQIYKLTGHAKIPIILNMVKRWLADGTNGKLVIFAHHLDVLNAIEKSSGVSNEPGSNTQYIRIDGSTNPQSRQDQIDSFQDNPSIKIALLGITAAGVGVTLTAASTIILDSRHDDTSRG